MSNGRSMSLRTSGSAPPGTLAGTSARSAFVDDIFIEKSIGPGMISRSFCLIALMLLALASMASAQPTVRNLGTPVKSMTIWGRLLVQDPVTGRSVLYAGTYTGEGWARLIRFDYALNSTQYFTLTGTKGGYGLCEGPDGKIYVGTVQSGRIFSFDPRTQELVDHGSAVGEEFVWTLQTGPDGRIYGATYPTARAVVLDPVDGRIRDLGRMHPTELYCRDLAVADNGRVFCGIGSHADLVAYDPSTGERRSILPEVYKTNSFVYTVMSEGNIIYAFLHFDEIVLIFDAETYDLLMEVRHPDPGGVVTIFRQYSGGPVLISGLPEGVMRYNATTGQLHPYSTPGWGSYDPRTGVAYSADTQVFSAYNVSSGEYLSQVNVAKDGEGMDIFSLGTGPDGCIYGGVYNLLHLFRYDPASSALEDLGVPIPGASGEFYSFHTLGEKLYMASYTYSVLSVYDPSLPWNLSTSPDSNPRKIGPVGDDQYRPPGLTSAADGRVYIGSLPAYGKMGGALSIYDPATDRFEVHRHIIPNQSVISLTTSQDGWTVYGGSSIQGGGGTTPIESEAHFFAWDVREGRKTLDIVPVGGAGDIPALCTAADGRIYGCAGGTIFVYDPAVGEIIHTEGSSEGSIRRMIPWSDGLIYGIGTGSLFRLKPIQNPGEEICFERLHHGGVDLAMGFDGSIYFASDIDLYVLENLPSHEPPEEDLEIYVDGLSAGWELKASGAEVDQSSTEKTETGTCVAASFDRFCTIDYSPPNPWNITLWEYDCLELSLNPGNSTVTEFLISKIGPGTTAKLSLFKDLGIELGPDRWHTFTIPTEDLKWVFGSRLDSLKFTVLGSGTIYLDSMVLVVADNSLLAPLFVLASAAGLWASRATVGREPRRKQNRF